MLNFFVFEQMFEHKWHKDDARTRDIYSVCTQTHHPQDFIL